MEQSSSEDMLFLKMRSRIEVSEGSGQYKAVVKEVVWNSKNTAVIVCDMWDKHWCKGAERRVAEMAPRMNNVLKELRKRGTLIIHAPSDTMDFYENHPARKLVQSLTPVELQVPLVDWKKIDLQRERELPIDDSDGGCGCEPKCKLEFPWTRQIEIIEIMEGDAVTDNKEVFYEIKQRRIENIIIMGVHTNMCVLGRPFGIRQMVMQGKNIVLMRDMTDTMYNPAMGPCVDHFTGTDLVIAHIEKYWCPTVTSEQIIGGKPFRFKEDTRMDLTQI
jgi:nicotinamidase-related amidase